MSPRALPTIRVRRRFWRVLSPRWSTEPTSGEGAAKHGGRFNARGRLALYMSDDFATAVAEYEQDLGIRPGTLCAYDIGASGVVDLTEESARRQLGIDLSQLRISWKHVLLVERKRPSTWDLAERLISAGATGMLVRSVRGPGRNLVLWRWNQASGPLVRVLDPFGELSTPRRRRRSR